MPRSFRLIENYIYLYHTKKFLIIPTYPESVSDSMQVNFSPTSPLARTAPIQSYTGSGPRTVQVKLDLHRDLMTQINAGVSNVLKETYASMGRRTDTDDFADDYVDVLIREIQAIAYPNYNDAARQVDPPQIAIKFGSDIFIKGVVSGLVTLDKSGPILANNKYAMVSINFNVTEIDPQSAETVSLMGSYRGDSSAFDSRIDGIRGIQ